MASVNIGGAVSVGVAAGIGLIGLFILLFVIIVVANRAEPDPRGLRPLSVYLFSMTFVMLQLAYAGTVHHHFALLVYRATLLATYERRGPIRGDRRITAIDCRNHDGVSLAKGSGYRRG